MAMPALHMEDFGSYQLAAAKVGSGPPVLLVAGLGGQAAFWAKQIAPLSAHFSLILHDHRGTGASSAYEGPFSIAQMAEDVLSLMDRYDIPKASLVGHSTGGAIGQYIALNHPNRLDKLVLSASWSRPSAYFSALFDLRLKRLETGDPSSYTIDGALRGFPAWYVMETPQLLSGGGPAQVPSLKTQRGRIEAILQHDLKAKLGTISVPTFVICAEDDAITPRPLSEEMAREIPGAALEILPTGGHFAPQAVPDTYTPAILNFLLGT
ncbi:MAG: alpha/beta fold hydrolase [Pseudomonadota bacterium]